MEEKNLKTLQSEDLIRKEERLRETCENGTKIKKNKKFVIISLYAEKGGVGKTTITSSLGYMLASRGKRVLMYDCDSQRNLTAWCFGKEINVFHDGNIDAFINNHNIDESEYRTFFEQVETGQFYQKIKPAHAIQIDTNLYLVPGNRDTCRLDEKISVAESNSLVNLPGSQNYYTARPFLAFEATAKKYDIDYVLVDLNPVRGILNKRIISTSDYLIVPCFADYYGYQVISNLKQDISDWHNELNTNRETANATLYKLPNKPMVEFLGCIINNYHPVSASHYASFKNGICQDKMRVNQQVWFEKIIECADTNFKILKGKKERETNLLGKIRHYFSLEQSSSLFFIPVPFLTEDHAWKKKTQKKKTNLEHQEKQNNNDYDDDDDDDDDCDEEMSDEEDMFIRMRSSEIHSTYSNNKKLKRKTLRKGFVDKVAYFRDVFSNLVEYIQDIVENKK